MCTCTEYPDTHKIKSKFSSSVNARKGSQSFVYLLEKTLIMRKEILLSWRSLKLKPCANSVLSWFSLCSSRFQHDPFKLERRWRVPSLSEFAGLLVPLPYIIRSLPQRLVNPACVREVCLRQDRCDVTFCFRSLMAINKLYMIENPSRTMPHDVLGVNEPELWCLNCSEACLNFLRVL